jgi:hypothetical protein
MTFSHAHSQAVDVHDSTSEMKDSDLLRARLLDAFSDHENS